MSSLVITPPLEDTLSSLECVLSGSSASLDSGHSSEPTVAQESEQSAAQDSGHSSETSPLCDSTGDERRPSLLYPWIHDGFPARTEHVSRDEHTVKCSQHTFSSVIGVPSLSIASSLSSSVLSSPLLSTSASSNYSGSFSITAPYRKSSSPASCPPHQVTIKPRKSTEELDASLSRLESLQSPGEDWIMIFDRLLKNPSGSARKRCEGVHKSPYVGGQAASTRSKPSYRKKLSAGDIDVRDRSYSGRDIYEVAKYPQQGRTDDEVDRGSVKSGSSIGGGKSRASSAPPVRRGLPVPRASAPAHVEVEPPHTTSAGRGGTLKRNPSLPRSRAASSATAAGGVDENYFFSAFEDAPSVNLYSNRDLVDLMTKIKDTISEPSNDWDKRVTMLRKVRSVVIAGGTDYEDYHDHLRMLELPLNASIKDLRSQVVREACVTVAYLSQELKNRVDRLCETVLPALIMIIPNGAKVISTSGTVCTRFIIKNCHHHRLIPILVRELTTSKSKEIRKAVCEFLEQLVYTWPYSSMERHAALMAEGIRKGISDADPEARAFSRKAYWGFAEHFKEEADKLLLSLDPSYRKLVQGDSTMPSSSSSHSLSTVPSAPRPGGL